MFKKLALISAAAAFAVPMAASAAQPVSLDVYYIADSTLDPEGSGSDDGDGWGGRLMVPFEGSGVGIHAEYQTSTLDDSDIDIDQMRLGASLMTQGNARFGVVGEYAKLKLDIPGLGSGDADGYGIHGRGEINVNEQFLLYGQIGYLSVSDSGDDLDGVEYLVGGVFNITPMFGVGVDYRVSDLEDDANDSIKFEDLRVGGRINFGV